MATLTESCKLVTVEEFLALPEDGLDRELIAGVVREYSMTVRNRWHSRTEALIVMHLGIWLRQQPRPHGEIVSGEAGFRLGGNSESVVGIDVAYVSGEVVAASEPDFKLFQGPPVLAVEVISPSDSYERIDEKVDLYLKSGVAIVWLIHSKRHTITIYRPGVEPEMVNALGTLTAEPELPGFRVAAAELFA